MSRLIDSHCHLAHLRTPIEEALAQASKAGVRAVIDIGMGTAESRAAEERVRARPGVVYASVGIHPNDVGEYTASPETTMRTLAELAATPGVVAIGETGLDFYRDRSPRDAQEASFRAHIALARESDKTLVIHCRDAHSRLLEVLGDDAPPRVVMHCFSGDMSFGVACAQRGYWCSFAGNLTYRANDGLRAVAKHIPEELLLVETDAPYLAPHPHRGKDNVPAFVSLTAECLASLRERTLDDFATVLDANTRRAFAL